MKIDNGFLVMELKDCSSCYGRGIEFGRSNCERCLGTNKTKKGAGKGKCRDCYDGTKVDTNKVLPCRKCNGNAKNFQMETPYDTIPTSEYVDKIPFVVHRSDRRQTVAESLLGVGIVSVSDYGAWKSLSDKELIQRANDRSYTQGIKLIRNKNDLRVCDRIGIFCNDNGYSVVPEFTQA